MSMPDGDKRFIHDLPSSLTHVGILLLRTVRQEFRGRLRYYQPSNEYVETPDNFWAVQIQPRLEAIKITVRGRPREFSNPLVIGV